MALSPEAMALSREAMALAAERPDRKRALSEHSWAARARTLLDALAMDSPGEGKPARVVVRPAVHYPREARTL